MSAWEATGATDEWYTPKFIFDALCAVFDLDVSAPADGPRHVPCRDWISEGSLQAEWSGFVWMNPPFGGRNGIAPWLDKFVQHGNGIALTPDRTSAPWWQDAASKANSVLLLRGKPKFERPDGTIGKSPGHGVSLWAAGEDADAILARTGRALGKYLRIAA